MPLFGLALLALPAHAEDWAHGETIQKAAYADVTPEGLNAVAGMVPALLPANIEIPETGDGGGTWIFSYEYRLSGAWVAIQVADATISPGNGVLNVTASLMVSLNDASDPFELYYELATIGDTCDGRVDAFPVTVATTMALEVIDAGGGTRTLDATIGAINVSYSLDNDDIHLDGCTVGDIEEVLGYLGLSIYDLVLGQLDSYLQDAVADMGPELETAIEEAFASASVNEELELNGAVAHLSLQPSDVVVTPSGVRVQMSGAMSADAAACVAPYDSGGSRKTPTEAPSIGATPSGVGSDYHVALTLSDDFTNQALYALWRGGLLCYALEPGGDFPLDTSILNALTGDAFAELFPASKPITLQTAPKAPPTTSFDGAHAIDVNLDQLGLEFFAELDGREAKLVAVDLSGAVGVDLGFDDTTGELGVVVDLDPAALTPSVGYNEFYPAANDAILESFMETFGSLVGTVVGGLLDNLAFALPAFEGIGLEQLQTSPAGNDRDWLGAYAWIGPVTYEAADGCGEDGGCSSDGCSGGCASSPSGPAFWAAFLGLVLLRRRA